MRVEISYTQSVRQYLYVLDFMLEPLYFLRNPLTRIPDKNHLGTSMNCHREERGNVAIQEER
jgi:hypothetical protein